MVLAAWTSRSVAQTLKRRTTQHRSRTTHPSCCFASREYRISRTVPPAALGSRNRPRSLAPAMEDSLAECGPPPEQKPPPGRRIVRSRTVAVRSKTISIPLPFETDQRRAPGGVLVTTYKSAECLADPSGSVSARRAGNQRFAASRTRVASGAADARRRTRFAPTPRSGGPRRRPVRGERC